MYTNVALLNLYALCVYHPSLLMDGQMHQNLPPKSIIGPKKPKMTFYSWPNFSHEWECIMWLSWLPLGLRPKDRWSVHSSCSCVGLNTAWLNNPLSHTPSSAVVEVQWEAGLLRECFNSKLILHTILSSGADILKIFLLIWHTWQFNLTTPFEML